MPVITCELILRKFSIHGGNTIMAYAAKLCCSSLTFTKESFSKSIGKGWINAFFPRS